MELGTLCNLTDGGENVVYSEYIRQKIGNGNRGKVHSKEQNEKCAFMQRGNKYHLGCTCTEESKRKMSIAHILIDKNSEVAASIIHKYVVENFTCKEIAPLVGVSKGTIPYCLRRWGIPLRRRGKRIKPSTGERSDGK